MIRIMNSIEVLQFSSGRDKFCALMQGYAKFASEAGLLAAVAMKIRRLLGPKRCLRSRTASVTGCTAASRSVFGGNSVLRQDSLSDGRKIFRLFKELREVYKAFQGPLRPLSFRCAAVGAGLAWAPRSMAPSPCRRPVGCSTCLLKQGVESLLFR